MYMIILMYGYLVELLYQVTNKSLFYIFRLLLSSFMLQMKRPVMYDEHKKERTIT